MRRFLIPGAVCLAVGVFFRFALIGYSTLAFVFWGLAALLFLLALCKKRGLRRFRIILLTLTCVGVLTVGLIEIPIIRNARTDAPENVDYLIVLGAGVNGTTPSLSLTNRLTAALAYLEANPHTTAILTGGQGPGEDVTEAEAMRIWLEARGVAPERLIKEEQATSTEENIAYSLEIIRSHGDEGASVAIVSSEYHLYRAKCMARDAGIEAYGVAGVTSLPVLKINYFIREAFAVAYMEVFG